MIYRKHFKMFYRKYFEIVMVGNTKDGTRQRCVCVVNGAGCTSPCYKHGTIVSELDRKWFSLRPDITGSGPGAGEQIQLTDGNVGGGRPEACEGREGGRLSASLKMDY